ncbi:hypothetical protein B0H13DRAFT_2654825 [Mycena leptocephala]|nr:hypothetical protein B0H13DRAFT_2654825 [Mycena leptocephala]
MKFSSSFSALLVVLPLMANVSGLAVPEAALVSRQRGGGRFGQGPGRQRGAAAAAAAAASSKAAAAAAAKNTAVAGGGKAVASSTSVASATNTAAAGSGAANNAGGGAATGTGAAAGAAVAPTDPQALQSSNIISPTVIQTTDDGQNPPLMVPITNGLQITSGSCNPIPIGQIPSVSNMPSSKYQSPKNLDVIPSGQTFTISLATKGIQLGTFTNAQKTYFANPQKLNAQGQIIGHTHVVMEAIDSLTTTTVTDPTKFFFFKGVNTAQDAQGNVAVDVTGGVTPGAYRMCTIVSSATHQPAIVAIAQHGSLDDCIYFTASPGGAAAAGAGAAAAGAGAAAGNATAAAGTGAAGAAAAGTAAATAAKGAAAGTAAAGTAAKGAAAGTAAAGTAAAPATAKAGKGAATAAKGAKAPPPRPRPGKSCPRHREACSEGEEGWKAMRSASDKS